MTEQMENLQDIGGNGGNLFPLEKERDKQESYKRYYELAKELRRERRRKDLESGWKTDPRQSRLDLLANEIRVRTRITEYEILNIGKLLSEAKQLLNGNFQDWIDGNFDFGYESALKFMRVYQYCWKHKEIIDKADSTVLCKISEPTFPGQLREFLFEQGNLEKLSDNDVQDLLDMYEKDGLDSVKESFQLYHQGCRIYRQVEHNLNQLGNAVKALENIKENVEDMEQDYKACWEAERADEINLTINEALDDCAKQLKQYLADNRNKFNKLLNDLSTNLDSDEAWSKNRAMRLRKGLIQAAQSDS